MVPGTATNSSRLCSEGCPADILRKAYDELRNKGIVLNILKSTTLGEGVWVPDGSLVRFKYQQAVCGLLV